MCAKNIHSLLHISFSDMVEGNCLAVFFYIDFVAWGKSRDGVKVPVTLFLCYLNYFFYTFTFCL